MIKDKNNLFVDPMIELVNTNSSGIDIHNLTRLKLYILKSKSPLKKAGTSLSTYNLPSVENDFWHNTVLLSKPAIGAHQETKY